MHKNIMPTNSPKDFKSDPSNTTHQTEKNTRVYDIAQLKHQLEAWKFVLVAFNNIVEWERQYDPMVIVVVDSLIFGLIFLYNPSVLTTVAILGLLFLILEYAVPTFSGYLFKTSDWDSTSELKFTRICERISNFYQHLIDLKDKMEKIRKEKQPLYFLLVFFFLIFCAYIGQSIDNILLTYLAALTITLTPGFRRHELISKSISKIKMTIGIGNKDMKTVDFRKNITNK